MNIFVGIAVVSRFIRKPRPPETETYPLYITLRRPAEEYRRERVNHDQPSTLLAVLYCGIVLAGTCVHTTATLLPAFEDESAPSDTVQCTLQTCSTPAFMKTPLPYHSFKLTIERCAELVPIVRPSTYKKGQYNLHYCGYLGFLRLLQCAYTRRHLCGARNLCR